MLGAEMCNPLPKYSSCQHSICDIYICDVLMSKAEILGWERFMGKGLKSYESICRNVRSAENGV